MYEYLICPIRTPHEISAGLSNRALANEWLGIRVSSAVTIGRLGPLNKALSARPVWHSRHTATLNFP